MQDDSEEVKIYDLNIFMCVQKQKPLFGKKSLCRLIPEACVYADSWIEPECVAQLFYMKNLDMTWLTCVIERVNNEYCKRKEFSEAWLALDDMVNGDLKEGYTQSNLMDCT